MERFEEVELAERQEVFAPPDCYVRWSTDFLKGYREGLFAWLFALERARGGFLLTRAATRRRLLAVLRETRLCLEARALDSAADEVVAASEPEQPGMAEN